MTIRKKEPKLETLVEYRRVLENLIDEMNKRVAETGAPNATALMDALVYLRAMTWHLTSDESKLSTGAFTFCLSQEVFYVLTRIKAGFADPKLAEETAGAFYDLLHEQFDETFDLAFPPGAEPTSAPTTPPTVH